MTAITGAYQGGTCVGLSLSKAGQDVDRSFFKELTALRPGVVFLKFPLATGERITEVLVRGVPNQYAPDDPLQVPCIVIWTTRGRFFSFGPYVPPEKGQYYACQRLVGQKGFEVDSICFSDQSTPFYGFRTGVTFHPSDYPHLEENAACSQYWSSSLPTVMPDPFQRMDLSWQAVDVSRFQAFRACLQVRDGTEFCIGLEFGEYVLGQWRDDGEIRFFALHSRLRLRNGICSDGNFVKVEEMDSMSPSVEGGDSVPIRGRIEW